MIRALGLKVGRIVLDPGHGGHDTGSVGPEGLREKDLVLDVAQRLGRLIETRMGSEVIFTRSDDTFIPLERRTEIANEAKADLFLSIHANSSPLRSAAGVETYYLNFTTSRSALDLASRENSGAQMSVSELQGLLEKIALKDKVEESREFASRVQTALYTLSAKTTDSRSKDRGVKRAPFVVLIGASMPSVLAEIGFVSNAHDESVMRREENRERTAEALFKGISSYADFVEPLSGCAAALARSAGRADGGLGHDGCFGGILRGPAEPVSENLHAIAARFLGNVQRLVGRADQLLPPSSSRPGSAVVTPKLAVTRSELSLTDISVWASCLRKRSA